MNSVLFVSSKTTYNIAVIEITVIEPTRGDNYWQAKDSAGFAARGVMIDWEQQQAVCPQGKVSNSLMPAVDPFKNDVIKIKFATMDCRVCPALEQCTKSTPPRRTMTLRPQAQYKALRV